MDLFLYALNLTSTCTMLFLHVFPRGGDKHYVRINCRIFVSSKYCRQVTAVCAQISNIFNFLVFLI